MMAGITEEQKKKDFQMMLACSTHLGTKNLDFQMTRYVWKRKPDGIHIINLGRTYDKLLLAARVIVAIENPADVCVISARPYGQRSILKYCQYTGATPIAGRFTPGTFTNQITNIGQPTKVSSKNLFIPSNNTVKSLKSALSLTFGNNFWCFSEFNHCFFGILVHF